MIFGSPHSWLFIFNKTKIRCCGFLKITSSILTHSCLYFLAAYVWSSDGCILWKTFSLVLSFFILFLRFIQTLNMKRLHRYKKDAWLVFEIGQTQVKDSVDDCLFIGLVFGESLRSHSSAWIYLKVSWFPSHFRLSCLLPHRMNVSWKEPSLLH